ncbi:MAG TPA: pterin-4-alpha-carbinolamine dehydratase [Opitutae bacterium]|nr:pterin-4-alpha-carbinolamine dehydratase [Opitutae bacterium]
MNSWQENDSKLQQTFRFSDYSSVRRFAHQVMEIADQQNHHPDMTVSYRTVIVEIVEHDTGKVGEKCRRLAAAITQAFAG